jgi:hypothetical protein
MDINQKVIEEDIEQLNRDTGKPLEMIRGHYFYDRNMSEGGYMLMQCVNDYGKGVSIFSEREQKVGFHKTINAIRGFLRNSFNV